MAANASQPPATVIEQLDEARATCRELMDVLRTENDTLAGQRIDVLENRLELKRQLTLRLERLVHNLKSLKPQWEDDRRSASVARLLATEVGEFQRLAAKNTLQLQAAHKVRGDVIALIKDTAEKAQPTLGYSKDGALTRNSSTTVLRKEI